MSLQFYEPFFSFNDFHRLVNDAFNERPSSERGTDSLQRSSTALTAFQPRMDIHESTEANTVTATVELPGLQKDDVKIDVQGNRLIISGEKSQEKNVDEKGFVLRERSTGRFWRALPLPAGTQPADIKASMADGVLSVTFPKTSPEQTPQRVAIA